MKGVAGIWLLAFVLGPSFALASLTKEQKSQAVWLESVSVPTPAEFFVSMDKQSQPDWVSFYREPVDATYSTRSQMALSLGALVTDGFVAVEAQDGQQVKNNGKEIMALASALGVGEDVLMRGKSIGDFAEKNDWFALREELEATSNEVRSAMVSQRDEALASLITVGAWFRALQIGSLAAKSSDGSETGDLLRQSDLVAGLRGHLEGLPEKERDGRVVGQTTKVLADLEETMGASQGSHFGADQVTAVGERAGKFLTEIEAEQP
tara:strand:+ start:532 stop:1326 length:795 start_codon:yes stop_codon:yes gene_type:complete